MTKYQEIATELINLIRSGTYRPWGAMEGEHMLAKRYQVSRATIRKALNVLKEQGYIHSRQGSGIYVNPEEFYQERLVFTMSDRYRRTSLDSKALKFTIEEATPEFDKLFNLGSDKRLVHYLRLRLFEKNPFTMEETWMPVELFPSLTKDTLKGSIMKYMEELGYVISHDFKTISAVVLADQYAKPLHKPIGSLSLQITHHVYLLKSVLAQITIETQGDNAMNALSVREQ